MTAERFEQILRGAVAGDRESLEQILSMYLPLIRKYCYRNGELDEDMMQYLMLHIALQILKFPL